MDFRGKKRMPAGKNSAAFAAMIYLTIIDPEIAQTVCKAAGLDDAARARRASKNPCSGQELLAIKRRGRGYLLNRLLYELTRREGIRV